MMDDKIILELSHDDVIGLYAVLLKTDVLIKYCLHDQYSELSPFINVTVDEIEKKLDVYEDINNG